MMRSSRASHKHSSIYYFLCLVHMLSGVSSDAIISAEQEDALFKYIPICRDLGFQIAALIECYIYKFFLMEA